MKQALSPDRNGSGQAKPSAEKVIHCAARKHDRAEETIRTVLEALRGGNSIAELGRREGLGGWFCELEHPDDTAD